MFEVFLRPESPVDESEFADRIVLDAQLVGHLVPEIGSLVLEHPDELAWVRGLEIPADR